ncbi:carbon-nitrogen hydrolase family protein [Sulfurovum sp. ST-21]|uniref:Carbon-nitrogen hydrolase family protein n=1 Tax=Sulfurovum indicum TaxID=2779528 RepID=A0A7M1S2Z7_9BACT|nr:carbon-nitrogen hydrolase family protein [Sulfurovum indicum]QOR61422.1 carbon-nitrogen hydrolase family protein [Sulfurovum indicum]
MKKKKTLREKRNPFSIAVIQASPVFMNKDASIEKACTLISDAAKKGASLAVFPEAFIPCYPDWIWHIPPGEITLNQDLYAKLLQQAVIVGSDDTDRLCHAAKKAGIYVVIGINEKNSMASGGSLNNTLLFIDPDGNIFGRHQKLIPTAPERTIWGYGDASTVTVYDCDLCKVGGLICWENYMPLVRYSLYAEGIELYLAPTYDEGETWNASMRHIAKEGRCFVAGCCMVLKKEEVLKKLPQLEPYYTAPGEWINKGNSVITNPDGQTLSGPLNAEEGILIAQIDLHLLDASKWNLDVAGHYARPDAFELTIRKSPAPIIRFK